MNKTVKLCKDCMHNLIQSATASLQKQHEAWKQQQQIIHLQQQHGIMTNAQLQLQTELAYIFSHTTPPVGLSHISYPEDFIPSGYQILPDGTNLYAYQWTKSSDCRKYSHPALLSITNRLNNQIGVYHQRFINTFYNSPEEYQYYLAQEYPMTFTGFSIAYCTDKMDSIQIIVQV